MLWIYVVLAFVGGVVVSGVYFYVREQREALTLERLRSVAERCEQVEQQLNASAQRVHELEVEKACLVTQIGDMAKETVAMREEQERRWEGDRKALRDEFQILASKVLEEKSTIFSKENKERLDALLLPLSENLKQFRERIDVVHKDNTEARSSLATELKSLKELNKQMGEEALNLTRALKGDSKMQGNWGEMILEHMLESVGLRRGEEYFVQETVVGDDNARLRPDIVVRFPDKRNVIVDSKVSLTAYAKYMESVEESLRDGYAKEHLESVKRHIVELSEKDYAKYDSQSLDYVIMFVPNDASYMLAMQYDTTLWNYALKKKVLLTSPTNLLSVLYMIGNLWQRFRQDQNALQIVSAANALYEKMATFVESYVKLGAQLQTVQRTYTEAEKQLKDGRGNLVTQFERMRTLGLSPKKQLPENMISEE